MEDYGSILWLLAIVGAMIYSSGSKARKKAQEAAKKALKEMQEKAHRQEAWPSWDVVAESADPIESAENAEALSLEGLDPEVPVDGAESYGGYTPSAVAMQSVFEPEFPERNDEGILRTDAASRKSKKIVVSNAGTDSTGNSANGIIERFDLRSAVIFSEILKPKYTEYE